MKHTPWLILLFAVYAQNVPKVVKIECVGFVIGSIVFKNTQIFPKIHDDTL